MQIFMWWSSNLVYTISWCWSSWLRLSIHFGLRDRVFLLLLGLAFFGKWKWILIQEMVCKVDDAKINGTTSGALHRSLVLLAIHEWSDSTIAHKFNTILIRISHYTATVCCIKQVSKDLFKGVIWRQSRLCFRTLRWVDAFMITQGSARLMFTSCIHLCGPINHLLSCVWRQPSVHRPHFSHFWCGNCRWKKYT